MFVRRKTKLSDKANNLTAICEPIVYTMWGPQHQTTLQASMSCYWNSFTCLYVYGVRSLQETHVGPCGLLRG
jgi:hypothetical protein